LTKTATGLCIEEVKVIGVQADLKVIAHRHTGAWSHLGDQPRGTCDDGADIVDHDGSFTGGVDQREVYQDLGAESFSTLDPGGD
jgi:hypothetical protein